jgi:adenylate kinase
MTNSKNIIIVMGPQGSGKSTQGKLLAEHINYKFISTGELIRACTPEQIGHEAWEQMKQGGLVSDSIVESLLFPVLQNPEFEGFILDGYPRTAEQMDTLLKFLNDNNLNVVKAYYVYISEEESLQRISKRAVIEGRPDEGGEALKQRLELYYSKTKPLLERYKEMNILVEVDGQRGIEEIQSDIRNDLHQNTSRN